MAVVRNVGVILNHAPSSLYDDGAALARRTLSVATWLCCVGAAALGPRCLNAQAAPGSSLVRKSVSSSANIAGVALDSLHEVPWSGATIVIHDLTIPHTDTISADENGHFHASAAGGHLYQLSATDSLADVLGLQITASLRARPDSTTRVVLVLPSATSITQLVCGYPAAGAGVLAGRVTSADHSADLRTATIEVTWIATQIDVATHRVASMPQVASADADKNGHFVVCGLPVPLRATLVAQMGKDSTTQVLTLTDKQQFAAAALILPSALTDVAAASRQTTTSVDRVCPPQSPGQPAPAVVTVLTTSGKPIARAEVTLDNDARFLTDTTGVVRLSPGRGHTHRLLIRKLGFAPLDVASSLSADRQSITVHLHEVSPVLDAVVVTAERDRARADFALRARTGNGYYITETDIARQKPSCFLDLLKRLPELRVKKSSGCAGGVSVFRGQGTIFGDPTANGCVRLIVDDNSVSGYDAVNVDDILGVEFYDETAAPVRYGTQCAVVVVWTKEARSIH